MSQNYYFDFNVTGSERKRLVKAISEFVGDDARYLGVPSCAYQVEHYTIDRKGCIFFDDTPDSDEIEGLLDALTEQGFVSISSNYELPEEQADESEVSNDSSVADSDTSFPDGAEDNNSSGTLENTDAATDTGQVETVSESENVASTDVVESIRIIKAERVNPASASTDTAGVDEAVAGIRAAKAVPSPRAAKSTGANGTVENAETAETGGETPSEDSGESQSVPELPADVIAYLNSLRAPLIKEVNKKFDAILRTHGAIAAPARRSAAPVMNLTQFTPPGETMSMSLYGELSTLRGTKPVLIKYGEETVYVASWKKAFAAVLEICNKQEQYHEALIWLRDTMVTRGRRILADSPQGMLSPLMVDKGLYLETNFSTEALLRMLRDRILNAIGFDANSITLEYRR